MPTERGFVEALGVGRAGLIEATVLHADGSTAIYTVADLDADPERFNERLSKLGILRDAMDRAEPVEISYEKEGDTRPIDSVKRLTRDVLARPTETTRAEGMVVGLAVGFQVDAGPHGEATDYGLLSLLTTNGPESFMIPMQAAERDAAMAMVNIARDAQASGASVAVTYEMKTRRVTEVLRNDVAGLGGSAQTDEFGAFVEEIAHTPVSNLMLVTVTTAPAFQSPGNIVPLVPFDPEARILAVVYNSPEYLLLLAALRDKLRVEVMALSPGEKEKGTGDNDAEAERLKSAAGGQILRTGGASMLRAMSMDSGLNMGTGSVIEAEVRRPMLVRGVSLQHALCTASRPVWIEVNRRALDVGPDNECVEGLPSNDMRPRSLRELDLPYRAAWVGTGCFNPGVYRLQLMTDRDVSVFIDGEEICLHTDEDGRATFGHACLRGEHEVRLVFENWKCKAKFDMDMYRIR